MFDIERRLNVDDLLRVAVCIQSLSKLGGKKRTTRSLERLARRCRHKIGYTQHSTANTFDEVVRELAMQVCKYVSVRLLTLRCV